MKTHIICWLLLAVDAMAAVITGNVRDTGLAPVATNIYFFPLSTPMALSPSVIMSSVKAAESDANGDFALTLAPGNYRATIGSNAADSLVLSVPSAETTNNWTSLVVGALTYHHPFVPAYLDRALLRARGDLLAGDGTNAVRLPAGAAQALLGADPAEALGLKWRFLTPADLTNALGGGAAHQVLGLNAAGEGFEYKTIHGSNGLEVMTAPGAITLAAPTIQLPPAWAQAVTAEFTNYASTSSVIPADDTPPQSGEGYQTVSATITPQNAANHLYFWYAGPVYAGSSTAAGVALFRDAEPSAVAAQIETVAGSQYRRVGLLARAPCLSTNAQTFKVRVGPGSAGTLYLNGNNSGRIYGGLSAHRLVIYEAP